MPVAIYPKTPPTKIFDYFNKILDQDKVKKLYSFSISRSICYIAIQISGHSINVSDFRVEYLVYCWQCCSLESSKKVRKSDFVNMTDDYIYTYIEKFLFYIKERKSNCKFFM